jgi:hypothetical protein
MKPTIKAAKEIAKEKLGRLPLPGREVEVGRNEREIFWLVNTAGKFSVNVSVNFAQWQRY